MPLNSSCMRGLWALPTLLKPFNRHLTMLRLLSDFGDGSGHKGFLWNHRGIQAEFVPFYFCCASFLSHNVCALQQLLLRCWNSNVWEPVSFKTDMLFWFASLSPSLSLSLPLSLSLSLSRSPPLALWCWIFHSVSNDLLMLKNIYLQNETNVNHQIDAFFWIQYKERKVIRIICTFLQISIEPHGSLQLAVVLIYH